MFYLVFSKSLAKDLRLENDSKVGKEPELVMQITRQLFQPLLERIEGEYEDLSKEIDGVYTQEAVDLRDFIQRKIRQLEKIRVALSYMHHDKDPLNGQADLRETLRQQKLELRFARRRWKRQLISQERIRRNQQRRQNVPTVAA